MAVLLEGPAPGSVSMAEKRRADCAQLILKANALGYFSAGAWSIQPKPVSAGTDWWPADLDRSN